MPWTPKQHRLFEAAAHNPAIARSSGIPQATAATMASEGIKNAAAPAPAPAAPAPMARTAAPMVAKTVVPKHNKNTVLAAALMKGKP